MVQIKQRRQHTGTLAFVSVVLVTDILSAMLASLYGATVIPWLLTVLAWIGEEGLHFFRGDLLSLLFILVILAAAMLGSLLQRWNVSGLIILGGLVLWFLTRILLKLHLTATFVPVVPIGQVLSPWAYQNPFLGKLWLGLYLLFHLISHDPDSTIPEVQQRSQHLATKALALPPPKDSKLVEGRLQKGQEAWDEVVVLNTLYHHEQKARLLRECEQWYTKALTRLYPPPIPHLTFPQHYFYVLRGDRIVWRGRTPVLTEELLNPNNAKQLLTEYARALFAYNTTDLWLRRVMRFYPDSNAVWLFCFPLGIFLWVPFLVKHLLGWNAWRVTRVLEADRFAWILGQGELLVHQLRNQQADMLPEEDTHLPTLTQRIGQLEGLLNEEHAQMQDRGIPISDVLATTKTLQRAHH